MTTTLIEDEVYDVGIRRVVNRPGWITTQRLRYAGHDGTAFRWYPAADDVNVGVRPMLLAPDQIATLAAVVS